MLAITFFIAFICSWIIVATWTVIEQDCCRTGGIYERGKGSFCA